MKRYFIYVTTILCIEVLLFYRVMDWVSLKFDDFEVHTFDGGCSSKSKTFVMHSRGCNNCSSITSNVNIQELISKYVATSSMWSVDRVEWCDGSYMIVNASKICQYSHSFKCDANVIRSAIIHCWSKSVASGGVLMYPANVSLVSYRQTGYAMKQVQMFDHFSMAFDSYDAQTAVSVYKKHDVVQCSNCVKTLESAVLDRLEDCAYFKSARHIYNNGTVASLYLPTKTIVFRHSKQKPSRLMIVLHGGDEIIFGGEDLLTRVGWLVVFVTNDNQLYEMINTTATRWGFDAMLYMHADSPVNEMRFHVQLFEHIGSLIQRQKWEELITFGIDGGYGHILHVSLHKMVSNILASMTAEMRPLSVRKFEVSKVPLNADRVKERHITLSEVYGRRGWVQLNVTASVPWISFRCYDLVNVICATTLTPMPFSCNAQNLSASAMRIQRPTLHERACDKERGNGLLVVAVCDNKYLGYSPYFIYFWLRAYPCAHVNIFVTENDKVVGNEISRYNNVLSELGFQQNSWRFETCFMGDLAFHSVKGKPIAAAARFLAYKSLFLKYEYMYVGDIDILVSRETPAFLPAHIKHAKQIGRPYSNAVRGCPRKGNILHGKYQYLLTGLHFIITKPYFKRALPVMRRYRKLIESGTYYLDEELLYRIVNESHGPPDTSHVTIHDGKLMRKYCYRPHHGVHLRALGCDPFRTHSGRMKYFAYARRAGWVDPVCDEMQSDLFRAFFKVMTSQFNGSCSCNEPEIAPYRQVARTMRYCKGPSSLGRPCPSGHYCDDDGRKIACPAGYFCPANVTKPIECHLGFYCPAGASRALACDKGFCCPPITDKPILNTQCNK